MLACAVALLACPCTVLPGGIEVNRSHAFADAARVVQAHVLAADTLAWISPGQGWRPVPDTVRYRLAVERAFKGEAPDTLVFVTSGFWTTCGISLAVGQRYVLYLAKAGIGSCGRRVWGAALDDELRWLEARLDRRGI